MAKPYEPHDRYFEKAKTQGYRARSVFKLQEIQDKFHLVRPGDRVLDLGAAPGSFMQYLVKIVGPSGEVIGIDLQEIKAFKEKNAHTVIADIFDDAALSGCLKNYLTFDIITSDLAPATSGIDFVDAGRSLELGLRVLEITSKYLKKGGHVLIKFLGGVEEPKITGVLKKSFEKVKHVRPSAVRQSSNEFYMIGQGKK